MIKAIEELTTRLFGPCPWLGIILIAMVPVVELRGAIPFALHWGRFLGANVLSWWQAYIFAIIGSTIPAFFVILLLKPLFSWMKRKRSLKKLATAMEKKYVKKSDEIQAEIAGEKVKKKVLFKKFLGTCAFVAVPLPLTGAWTGSAVAAYLDMPYWLGVLAVVVGNIISGAIMLCICLLLPGYENIIMYSFLGLAGLFVICSLLWKWFKKRHEITADESVEDKKQ